jgi:hypothetical protein
MGGSNTLPLLFAALAAAAAGGTPARGQCRLCDAPSTALSASPTTESIALEIETSLDFDRLILAGTGQGVAVIRLDGSATAQGALEQISGRVMVGTAVVHGVAGRAIRVELPRQIELRSIGGGRITLDDIVSDLPDVPRLDSGGRLSFRFGGKVTVTADSEGDYRGELPITVEYQ